MSVILPSNLLPIPLSIIEFDLERQHFMKAISGLLLNEALHREDLLIEIESTIAVIRNMARLSGVQIDA